MGRNFTRKYVASIPLDGGEVEFSNDNFGISLEDPEQKFLYGSIVDNSFTNQSYEIHEALDGAKAKIRYGKPVSINTQTYWSVLLFARAYGNTNESVSISKMIDMSIKNIVLSNFGANDKDVEQVNMWTQTSSFKRRSSGIRKFIYIEDEDDFKEFFVPDLTYHADEFLRLILLTIVSPELLSDDEIANIQAFFCAGQLKDPIGISMEPEILRDEIMNTKFSFASSARAAREFISSKEYEEYLIDIGPAAKVPEYRNFIRRVRLFSMLTDKSLQHFSDYFESIKWLSERFGTIRYK